jgi:DNA-binding NtrC family response regulator
VDDAEAIRLLVHAIVGKLGFTADVASGSGEAISLFASDPERYALAIIDLNLPGPGGIDLLREFRRVRPEMPAILISGSGKENALGTLSGRDRTEVLNKPFTSESLAAAIRAALEPQFRRESR